MVIYSSQPSIDWKVFWQSMRFVFLLTAWTVWLLFVVLPTAFGLHNAPLYPTFDNTLFVLVGFIFCLSALFSLVFGHFVRFSSFVLVSFVLAYWF